MHLRYARTSRGGDGHQRHGRVRASVSNELKDSIEKRCANANEDAILAVGHEAEIVDVTNATSCGDARIKDQQGVQSNQAPPDDQNKAGRSGSR